MNAYPKTALSADNTSAAIRATRFVFLICGLGVSAWAPMVPFVKDRLHLNDAQLGLLLLFLGVGAICTMPLTGKFIPKIGARKLMLYSGVLMALTLPLLLVVQAAATMAIILFLYGAGIGSLDVAMNAHGVTVQNQNKKPIMSSLHGLFSVGGLLGPLVVAFLLKSGISLFFAAVIISATLILLLLAQYPKLLSWNQEQSLTEAPIDQDLQVSSGKSAWVNPGVIFLGILCFISFLAEGAVLDWGAVYLREVRGIGEAFAGLGYTFFSVAMAVVRLTGDNLITRFDKRVVVSAGSLLAGCGYFLFALAPDLWISFLGLILVGAGAANIVPVLFGDSGKIKGISGTAALAAVTALGYTGQLAGPASLGFLARELDLTLAMVLVGILLLGVSISYFFAGKSFDKQVETNQLI